MASKIALMPYVILDDQGDVVGHAGTLTGCYRQIAASAEEGYTWTEVREALKEDKNGVRSIIVTVIGEQKPTRFEVTNWK